MDIMELGAIGELVGGIAVIASLIYVAIQIRQGNRAGAREAHRAWVADMNRGLFEPQLDAEFNEVFQKANADWFSIPPRDQARVNAVYSHMMNLFQEGFAQRERGETDQHLARQLDVVAATMLQMPGMKRWWDQAAPFYSPSFQDHIRGFLASKDCPPPCHHILPWYVGAESAVIAMERDA